MNFHLHFVTRVPCRKCTPDVITVKLILAQHDKRSTNFLQGT